MGDSLQLQVEFSTIRSMYGLWIYAIWKGCIISFVMYLKKLIFCSSFFHQKYITQLHLCIYI